MGWRRTERREQRSETRSEVQILARLTDDRGDYKPVLDISSGGLRMKTRLPIQKGQWVPVRLFFPDLTEEVEIMGRVAWRRRSGEFGLDYRDHDDDDSGLLRVMITHQAHINTGLH